MELWIRSQDKEALIKVDKIFYWNTCPEMPNTGKHYLGNKEWVGNGDYTKLGEYKTQKRALEVLDEIQNILKPQKIIKTIDNTAKIDNLLYIVNPTYETITQFDTYVYEMPKD